MRAGTIIFQILLLSLSMFWSNNLFAEGGILELEETEVKSSIPEAPDLSSFNALRNPDKAIDITLDESFIPKIISSMKKEPF